MTADEFFATVTDGTRFRFTTPPGRNDSDADMNLVAVGAVEGEGDNMNVEADYTGPLRGRTVVYRGYVGDCTFEIVEA